MRAATEAKLNVSLTERDTCIDTHMLWRYEHIGEGDGKVYAYGIGAEADDPYRLLDGSGGVTPPLKWG